MGLQIHMTMLEDLKRACWARTSPVSGQQNSWEFRKDCLGNLVRYADFGNRHSPFGWELDHIVSRALGGSMRSREPAGAALESHCRAQRTLAPGLVAAAIARAVSIGSSHPHRAGPGSSPTKKSGAIAQRQEEIQQDAELRRRHAPLRPRSACSMVPLDARRPARRPRRRRPNARAESAPRRGCEARFTRVRAEDKRVINAKTDVNQLVPFKYKWAWDKYLSGCANHWMPQEVNMNRDIALWKNPNGLTDDERLIVKRNLGFFVTADSLAANNIVLGHLPPHHRARVPPVPAAPGLRGGDPHPRLPVHRRDRWAWTRARSSPRTRK